MSTTIRTLPAAPADVYHAWTSAPALRAWLATTVHIEARPGGPLYLAWDDGAQGVGTFTTLERDAQLAWTWQLAGDSAPGTVNVTLTPNGRAATDVTVAHAGPAGRPDWATALADLQTLLENGLDPRLMRRPFFGLNGAEEVTPAQAAELGLPVTNGLRITGLVEGSGAQRAGLAPGDVVVGLGDQPVTGGRTFGAALGHYTIGAQIPVHILRAGAAQTITVELGRRPDLAAPPVGPAELAASAQTNFTTLAGEMETALAGLSDMAAATPPAPGAWSAKEVLAHLLAVEYDTQAWITSIVEDAPDAPGFHTNELVRVQPLAAAYPTLAALVAALHCSEGVTVAMLAALPPDLFRRKYMLAPLAGWITFQPDHTREHLELLRARPRPTG